MNTNIKGKNEFKLTRTNPDKKYQLFTHPVSNEFIINSYDGSAEGIININRIDSSLEEKMGIVSKIGFVLFLSFQVAYFSTDVTIISGNSMEPTFYNNQIIVKTKLYSLNKKVKRNSVVNFINPSGDKCIKRVVGVPGDTIEVGSSFGVKINGKTIDNIDHRYLVKPPGQSQGDFLKTIKEDKYTLKSNQYYLVGDNKDHSTDSRHFGPIDFSNILSIVTK